MGCFRRRRSPAHTRARIETVMHPAPLQEGRCRPLTRGRGSKRRAAGKAPRGIPSPAHTRARIETCSTRWGSFARTSPAHTRARIETTSISITSCAPTSRPLTRGRGSKPSTAECSSAPITSPAHTRARIETCNATTVKADRIVARSHAGADRNHSSVDDSDKRNTVARSHAGADRNIHCPPLSNRSPPVARSHAGADRNKTKYQTIKQLNSRPLTRGRGSKRTITDAAGITREVARSHAGADRNHEIDG